MERCSACSHPFIGLVGLFGPDIIIGLEGPGPDGLPPDRDVDKFCLRSSNLPPLTF